MGGATSARGMDWSTAEGKHDRSIPVCTCCCRRVLRVGSCVDSCQRVCSLGQRRAATPSASWRPARWRCRLAPTPCPVGQARFCQTHRVSLSFRTTKPPSLPTQRTQFCDDICCSALAASLRQPRPISSFSAAAHAARLPSGEHGVQHQPPHVHVSSALDSPHCGAWSRTCRAASAPQPDQAAPATDHCPDHRWRC